MSDRTWIKWIVAGVILAALPVLVYVTAQFGYCHSWWGKENLRLRSWWLCRCPPEFEQSLYPAHIEVMYSACLNVSIRPIPGGRYLLVQGDESFLDSGGYILDTLTGQREPFFLPQDLHTFDFLTPDLLLFYPQYQYASTNTYHLFNRRSSHLIPFTLATSELIPEPYLADGSPNPELIALLERAEAVYVVWRAKQMLILEAGWEDDNESIVLLDENEFSGVKPGWIQTVVDAGNIDYIDLYDWTKVEAPRWEVTSPDGQYVARPSGIYDSVADRIVVASPDTDAYCASAPGERCYPGYLPCCWVADSQAVIYQYDSTIPTSVSFISKADVGAPESDRSGFWMPILKVNLP